MDKNLKELGDLIQQERVRRIGALERAAEAGGVNHNTWRRMERGLPVRSGSYDAVDRAFDLPIGTTRNAVLGGAGFSRLVREFLRTRAAARQDAAEEVTAAGPTVHDSLDEILSAVLALPDDAFQPQETRELLEVLQELRSEIRQIAETVHDMKTAFEQSGALRPVHGPENHVEHVQLLPVDEALAGREVVAATR